MPPKAKAKAAAMLRRPAGHPRVGALRRPAGRGEVRSPWAQGLEQELWKVSPTELGPGSLLAITEADYFGAPVKFAGEVTQLVIEHGESTVLMKALGTDHEGLLRAHSARPLQLFKGHICPPGCGKLTSGEYLIHCVKGRRLNKEQEEGWTSNLEGHRPPAEEGDEMAELRERSHRLRGGDPGGGSTMRQGEVPPPGRLEAEASVDKKRKKKDKKEKKRTKEVSEGRHPAVAAQKELRDLYAGTALDPQERIRRRILGKAQKFAARKKPRSSSGSSGSSSSSTSPTVEGFRGLESVFAEENKVRALAERFPGALTLEAVTAMRQALLTTSGEELDDTGVKPVALLYYRSVLCRRATGAQSREMLNLAAALDHLLRGRVVCAADIISQRLKAQEAVTQGTSWSVALRMEVPPPESGSLVSRAELQQARREDYSEAQARWRTQANSGSKGDGKGKGKNQKGHQEPWKKDEKKEEARKGKGSERK